ncbi:MAG: cysteine-rich CWC family protein [Bacteroidota bacterium]
MPEHEVKKCPRCGKPFECKVGAISLCQCAHVQLNDEERQHLREQYSDCLCASCMIEEKHIYNQKKSEKKIEKYRH